MLKGYADAPSVVKRPPGPCCRARPSGYNGPAEHCNPGGLSAIEDTCERKPWAGPLAWLSVGIGLVALTVTMAALSRRFVYGSPLTGRPIAGLVIVHVAAGVVFLIGVWLIGQTRTSRILLIWVVLVGAVMRGTLMPTKPVMEDDWYRYLWDGGVAVAGHDPYAIAPQSVLDGDAPADLLALADDSGLVIDRVNHPRLRTVYPPVAQAAFGLSYLIAPWSLNGWRAVVLGFDAATLVLLLLLLCKLRVSPLWVLVYWWNPVVVKELVNSAHMDAVALPFVLGAMLLAVSERRTAACAVLALAVGAKFWPVLLLPVLVWPLLRQPRRLLPALGAFAVAAAAVLAPMAAAFHGEGSGLLAYGGTWEMNDALFMVFLWPCRLVCERAGGDPAWARTAARLVVAALLGLIILWTASRPVTGPTDLPRRCLVVTAAAFLLSPTQFPWYYVWMVPLLAVAPNWALLSFTCLLPLYYLRFHFKGLDCVDVFDRYVVWLQFVPVWCLLAWQWRCSRRGGRVWLSEAEP